jgi:hypothetical protein
MKQHIYYKTLIDALSEKLRGFLIPRLTHLRNACLCGASTGIIIYVIWNEIPIISAAINHARWLEEVHVLLDRSWCTNRANKTRVELGTGGLYYMLAC